MAVAVGLVQRITWIPPIATACFFVGPSMQAAEIFYILIDSSDSEAEIAFKCSMITLLVKAQTAGYPVEVVHPNNSAEASSVAAGEFNISPIGQAIHNDFYSVSGSGIPADAVLVFESPGSIVTVTPDLVRPHWVFVSELPPAVATGRNLVRLSSATFTSNNVPVEVSSGPRLIKRVLFGGQPKTKPYTIVFVANPGIQTEAGGLIADPVLTNRPGFHSAVGYCLRNLFTVTEDLLRQGNLDAQLRLVTIFDASLPATVGNSLAHEIPPNMMETLRNKLGAFVSQYGEFADMVFVMHGSTTHGRATAWFTSDDPAKPGVAFTYDGVAHVHGQFPAIPGSAALPLNMDRTGLTPLHEFGHGASDFTNGKIVDLYVDDGPGGFQANKKFRALSTDAVPANFANYNGTNFQADPNRDRLGYPNTWRSYHPSPTDATRPNVMDNYWLAFDDPQRCRFDRLIYPWLTDRIRAKLGR